MKKKQWSNKKTTHPRKKQTIVCQKKKQIIDGKQWSSTQPFIHEEINNNLQKEQMPIESTNDPANKNHSSMKT